MKKVIFKDKARMDNLARHREVEIKVGKVCLIIVFKDLPKRKVHTGHMFS
jgi:hypothetical protein